MSWQANESPVGPAPTMITSVLIVSIGQYLSTSNVSNKIRDIDCRRTGLSGFARKVLKPMQRSLNEKNILAQRRKEKP
jgi:hypothetical protein